MGRRHAQPIDRPAIERATSRAVGTVRHYQKTAKRYAEDEGRAARLEVAECVVCFGGSRIGGAAMTSAPCPLCGERLNSGNTNIDVLCLTCALANGLCKHCGADVDLKFRRKARPYESWPPAPQCINPECQQPIRGEYCCSCGARQVAVPSFAAAKLEECNQCGKKREPWQSPDDNRCPAHACPISSCDGTLEPPSPQS